MAEDNTLDTTIHEPSITLDEVEMLLFALERSRAQFAWKCGGLDAAGLRQEASGEHRVQKLTRVLAVVPPRPRSQATRTA